MIYSFRCIISFGFTFRAVRSAKNRLSSLKTSHTSRGNKSLNATGIRRCMNTWQSWLFMPNILYLYMSTHRAIFETIREFNIFKPFEYNLSAILVQCATLFKKSTGNAIGMQFWSTTHFNNISSWFDVIFSGSFNISKSVKYIVKNIISTWITSKLCWIKLELH